MAPRLSHYSCPGSSVMSGFETSEDKVSMYVTYAGDAVVHELDALPLMWSQHLRQDWIHNNVYLLLILTGNTYRTINRNRKRASRRQQ